MTAASISLLLIGESDVGKTHYGAQLLRRLNSQSGSMALIDSRNIEPFSGTMDAISQGRAGQHTPVTEMSESQWTISRQSDGREFDLIWPDYAGESLSTIVETRRITDDWEMRIKNADAWALMVRTSRVRLPADVLTRKIQLEAEDTQEASAPGLSAQSRLIEILQMMQHRIRSKGIKKVPPLCLLLSCYDETDAEGKPLDFARRTLPMITAYIETNWLPSQFAVFGVSQLGQSLRGDESDEEFIDVGPDKMGYIINPSGDQTDDLLAPVGWMLEAIERPSK